MRLSSLIRGGASTATQRDKDGLPSRPRILIVDDDDDARLVVCDRLLALGFDVVGEDNGVAGLSRMADERERVGFSGMLLELQMPVLGGMAVLQEMRDRYPQIPVIVMSDASRVDKLRIAVKSGAKEYLVKPFDAELLKRKCLRVFLGRSDPA